MKPELTAIRPAAARPRCPFQPTPAALSEDPCPIADPQMNSYAVARPMTAAAYSARPVAYETSVCRDPLRVWVGVGWFPYCWTGRSVR
jgi:hypothetical protein